MLTNSFDFELKMLQWIIHCSRHFILFLPSLACAAALSLSWCGNAKCERKMRDEEKDIIIIVASYTSFPFIRTHCLRMMKNFSTISISFLFFLLLLCLLLLISSSSTPHNISNVFFLLLLLARNIFSIFILNNTDGKSFLMKEILHFTFCADSLSRFSFHREKLFFMISSYS